MKKQIQKHLSSLLALCLAAVLVLPCCVTQASAGASSVEATKLEVKFVDSATPVVLDSNQITQSNSEIICAPGDTVEYIRVTMNEAVSVDTEKDKVTIEGTSGDCKYNESTNPGGIQAGTLYGTIALYAGDTSNKTIEITPDGAKGTAGPTGKVKFTIQAGAVKAVSNASITNSAYNFSLRVQDSAVSPVESDYSPASATDISGYQTFSYHFGTTNSKKLQKLELDCFLNDAWGDDTSWDDGDDWTAVSEHNEPYCYYNNVSFDVYVKDDGTLDNSTTGVVKTATDDINSIAGVYTNFHSHSDRNDIVTIYNNIKDETARRDGEKAVEFYEALGFTAGMQPDDLTNNVLSNISYVHDDTPAAGYTDSGTWTIRLNAAKLYKETTSITKLTMLTAVHDDDYGVWGENNYSINKGALTHAFQYNIVADTTKPTAKSLTAKYTTYNGGSTADITIPESQMTQTYSQLSCKEDDVVDTIEVKLSEPVTLVSEDDTNVYMYGTSGECKNHNAKPIPDVLTNYPVYGTISLKDDSGPCDTLVITPGGSLNKYAAYTGDMRFVVAGGAFKDYSENENAQMEFRLKITGSEVSPVGSGISPAGGSTVRGNQTFSFPFSTTDSKTLQKLELDCFLGDDWGNDTTWNAGDDWTSKTSSHNYYNNVSFDVYVKDGALDGSTDGQVKTATEDINSIAGVYQAFHAAENRAAVVTKYNIVKDGKATRSGEKAVEFYEALGFTVGMSATDLTNNVLSKISYVKDNPAASGTDSGTWKITLNAAKLHDTYSVDTLTMLVSVHDSEAGIWGINNYSINKGALTKVYQYTLAANSSYVPSSGGSSGGSTASDNKSEVIVDGEKYTIGTQETKNGETTVTPSQTDLQKHIQQAEKSGEVEIPVTLGTGADSGSATLVLENIEDMSQKDMTLSLQVEDVSYNLSTSAINTQGIMSELGATDSSQVAFNIGVTQLSGDDITLRNGELVLPPVEFNITASYNGRSFEVENFNSFVEREILIPEGIDPNKITTAVVADKDGNERQVPTKVYKDENGRYCARINSLTNSTYAIVYNPVEFTDVANHWAKDAVNDMGSRMVVSGVGDNCYEPDRSITRAEFAVIIVRALGLEPGTGSSSFTDVSSADWYCGYVQTAASYGIISGYPDGTFHADNEITREQAMTMIARAMKITKLESGLTASESSTLVKTYTDGADVSSYAVENIAACLKTGIVTGRPDSTLAPGADVTRAEVAVMIQRLLQKSALI